MLRPYDDQQFRVYVDPSGQPGISHVPAQLRQFQQRLSIGRQLAAPRPDRGQMTADHLGGKVQGPARQIQLHALEPHGSSWSWDVSVAGTHPRTTSR